MTEKNKKDNPTEIRFTYVRGQQIVIHGPNLALEQKLFCPLTKCKILLF